VFSVNFYSDNTATACPEIMQALQEANTGYAAAYSEDRWSARLDQVFGEFFGTRVRVFAVTTGTAANALALAAMTPPYGAIFAHDQAHIFRDECGAPEFFCAGAKMLPLPAKQAKLTAEGLAAALDEYPPSVHSVRPTSVSIAQATELGTVYQPGEVAALGELARRRQLKLHMDGARFANAVAHLKCHPGEITWRAGVDVLSFGATKNGALGAEAVVFFNTELADDFELRRKRSGHLLSKSRYVAAQLLAYLESGVWQRNALRANRLTSELVDAAGGSLLYPVESNQLFLQLGESGKQRLRAAGFGFFDWDVPGSGKARLVVSWNQPDSDIAALRQALSRSS